MPSTKPVSLGRCSAESNSILRPSGVIHIAAILSRSGDSQPERLICATTAKIRPDTTDRRFPVAASTSNRPEQPRARTMPAPNINPPIIAPDQLPGTASTRASEVDNSPVSRAA